MLAIFGEFVAFGLAVIVFYHVLDVIFHNMQ